MTKVYIIRTADDILDVFDSEAKAQARMEDAIAHKRRMEYNDYRSAEIAEYEVQT